MEITDAAHGRKQNDDSTENKLFSIQYSITNGSECNHFLQRATECLHAVGIECVAEKEPIGSGQTDDARKETPGRKRAETAHANKKQRHETDQLGEQQTS